MQSGVVQCPEGRKLFSANDGAKEPGTRVRTCTAETPARQQILEEVFALLPILRDKKDDPAGSLSGGQQQMVAIGRAMMGRPKVAVAGQAFAGLGALVIEQMFEVIQRVNRSGTTVLLAEQNAFAALKIAHRAYVLENGHIVREGKPDELLADDSIRKAYIGA